MSGKAGEPRDPGERDQEEGQQAVSRRDVIRNSAINAAVIALFGGAMSFDSLAAKAIGRMDDIQAADRIGSKAAGKLNGGTPASINSPMAAACAPDTTFTCGEVGYECGTTGTYVFGCTVRDFDCGRKFTCGTYGGSAHYNCSPATNFQCDNWFWCPSANYSCSYICNPGEYHI
jgi:hypothetical protein